VYNNNNRDIIEEW